MDARDRDRRRARLIPRVAEVTRSIDFRTSLTARLGSREHTIIVTLPDDEMAYVFDQLYEAGGAGVIALPNEDDVCLAVAWPASAERIAVAEEDDAIAQIHEAASVLMFFTLLHSSSGPIVFERLAARLVDHGELQPV